MRSAALASLAAALCALLSSGSADARTIVPTPVVSYLGHQGCPAVYRYRFPQAHLLPGEVLSDVSLSLSASFFGRASITPDDGFPVGARVWFSVGLTVNGPGIPPKQDCWTSDFDLIGNLVLANGDAWDSQLGSYVDMGIADVSPQADYAAYTGPGYVDIWPTVTEDSDYCEVYGGSIACSLDLNWGLVLTYRTAVVPEPATLLTLLPGVLGVLGVRQHRRGKLER